MDNLSSVLSVDYSLEEIERLPLIETQGFGKLVGSSVIKIFCLSGKECCPDNNFVTVLWAFVVIIANPRRG